MNPIYFTDNATAYHEVHGTQDSHFFLHTSANSYLELEVGEEYAFRSNKENTQLHSLEHKAHWNMILNAGIIKI